jgi:hypothetical protein
LPFTTALELPICKLKLCESRTIVIILRGGSHVTIPPNASTTALIGRRVLLFLIKKGRSKVFEALFIVNSFFPIWRMITA